MQRRCVPEARSSSLAFASIFVLFPLLLPPNNTLTSFRFSRSSFILHGLYGLSPGGSSLRARVREMRGTRVRAISRKWRARYTGRCAARNSEFLTGISWKVQRYGPAKVRFVVAKRATFRTFSSLSNTVAQ